MSDELKSKESTKEHWGGNSLQISSDKKKIAGLPETAFFAIVTNPMHWANGSVKEAVVYDPVHWIYGRGDTVHKAADDCLNNITAYRSKHTAEFLDELTKGFAKRLEEYGHPFDSTMSPKSWKRKSTIIETKTESIKFAEPKPSTKKVAEEKPKATSMDDILKDLGL